jgi:hypothetical protein
MTITIVLPEGEGVKVGTGTTVFNHKGDEIKNITNIKLEIGLDLIVYARVEIAVGSIENMDNIHALLGTETLEQIAGLHGFKMVPIDG